MVGVNNPTKALKTGVVAVVVVLAALIGYTLSGGVGEPIHASAESYVYDSTGVSITDEIHTRNAIHMTVNVTTFSGHYLNLSQPIKGVLVSRYGDDSQSVSGNVTASVSGNTISLGDSTGAYQVQVIRGY